VLTQTASQETWLRGAAIFRHLGELRTPTRLKPANPSSSNSGCCGHPDHDCSLSWVTNTPAATSVVDQFQNTHVHARNNHILLWPFFLPERLYPAFREASPHGDGNDIPWRAVFAAPSIRALCLCCGSPAYSGDDPPSPLEITFQVFCVFSFKGQIREVGSIPIVQFHLG